jgi:hypothetical protein
MEMFYKALLMIHVVAGFCSLVTFMVPVIVKKGSNIHKKVGWIYVYNMWIVVGSAGILSFISLIDGHIVPAVFLGYLALITASPLWYGMAMLKYKKDIPDSYLKKRKIVDIVIVVWAILNIAYFIHLGGKGQSILLLIFGILGLTNIPIAIAPLKKIKTKANWYIDHLEGMITAGIAAYTAFFAFGGATFFGHFFNGPLIAIPWALPGIIGGIIINRYKRKYRNGAVSKVTTLSTKLA